MNIAKRRALEAAGWRIGTADDFLNSQPRTTDVSTAIAMAKATATPHGRVYDSLTDLVAGEGKKLNDENFRAYKVVMPDGEKNGYAHYVLKYVATNSPANAAQACVELERVPSKELLSVALNLIDAGE